jgi:hypothetical protein
MAWVLRPALVSVIVAVRGRVTMPMTAKQKLLHRRQRRVGKLRALKAKLKGTQDSKTRERLQTKVHRLDPFQPTTKK